MQAVPVFKFWQFGTGVRYLQDARAGHRIHGTSHVLQNIAHLLRQLEELSLRVSARAADNLRELEAQLQATPNDAKLTESQATKLRECITQLRLTLRAELQGINAYTLSPKRIDVEKLTNDIPALLAPGVFAALTDVAQFDLTEAGKCIAFERPTAGAFHLLRATEEVLRRYYCYFVRRNRVDPLLWFPMVQALTQHRLAKRNEALNRNLDNIRLSFRNPTQHPDKIYDIQEVQDLFGLCVDVINRMQRGLQGSSR